VALTVVSVPVSSWLAPSLPVSSPSTLGEHGVGGLGDDGGGETSDETGAEVDTGLGTVGESLLVDDRHPSDQDRQGARYPWLLRWYRCPSLHGWLHHCRSGVWGMDKA
jgi:hypothetical protein